MEELERVPCISDLNTRTMVVMVMMVITFRMIMLMVMVMMVITFRMIMLMVMIMIMVVKMHMMVVNQYRCRASAYDHNDFDKENGEDDNSRFVVAAAAATDIYFTVTMRYRSAYYFMTHRHTRTNKAPDTDDRRNNTNYFDKRPPSPFPPGTRRPVSSPGGA